MQLTEIAYAKLNLALHVRSRRDDGYHAIESLFAFVDDGDILSAQMREDGEIHLAIEGPFADALTNDGDNLVMLAAAALREATGTTAGAYLQLTKNLPIASGIGGGSADAAATMRVLNHVWCTGLNETELSAIAEPLGADVPACVISRTLIGTGRGDAMSLCGLNGLSGKPVLLVNPLVPLSTGPVFRAWDGKDRGALDTTSLEAIILNGRNDLEAPALTLVPEIADILYELRGLGGVNLARMSGSGATCFALFDTVEQRDSARTSMEQTHPAYWTMTGLIR